MVDVIGTLDALDSLVGRTMRFVRLLAALGLVAFGVGLVAWGISEEMWGPALGGVGALVGGITLWVVTLGEYRAIRLARRGTQAQATLVGIRDSGWRNGDEDTEGEPFWSMAFDIGGRRVKAMQDLHPACRSALRPGDQVVVRVGRTGRWVMLDCPATMAWHGGSVDPRWIPDRVHRPLRGVRPGRTERTRFSGVAVVLGTLLVVAGGVLLVLAGDQDVDEARTAMLITGGTLAGIGAFWLLLVVLMRWFGRTPKGALPARCHVVSAQRSGTTINDRRVVQCRLQTQLADGRAWEHEARIAVPSVVLDRVGPGTWLVAHISPEKPNKVRVDWDATTTWLDGARR